MHKIIIFFQKKSIKKEICLPTLPKIFRPITRNTLLFLFGLTGKKTKKTTTTINYDSLLNSLKKYDLYIKLCLYVLQVTAKDDLLNNESLLINSLILLI